MSLTSQSIQSFFQWFISAKLADSWACLSSRDSSGSVIWLSVWVSAYWAPIVRFLFSLSVYPESTDNQIRWATSGSYSGSQHLEIIKRRRNTPTLMSASVGLLVIQNITFRAMVTVGISLFFYRSRLFLIVMTYLVPSRHDCEVFVASSKGRINYFYLHISWKWRW